MTSDILSGIPKPGDGCKLTAYVGDNFTMAMETLAYIANLIEQDGNMEGRDDIPFDYKPASVTMLTKMKDDQKIYTIKVEGVLI